MGVAPAGDGQFPTAALAIPDRASVAITSVAKQSFAPGKDSGMPCSAGRFQPEITGAERAATEGWQLATQAPYLNSEKKS